MMTFWAPFLPIPPAMPVGKVMGEEVTKDPQSRIGGRRDGELVVAEHQGHGEAGIAVGAWRVHEVAEGILPVAGSAS